MNPAITGGSTAVNNLNGQPITDQFNQPGFPGFDGLFASTTLAYIAQMQEAGIPVTFGYISDATTSTVSRAKSMRPVVLVKRTMFSS